MRILLLLTLCLPLVVWSHGGGTDANGCHRDSKAGGKHCHNGGSRSPSTIGYSNTPRSSYDTYNTESSSSYSTNNSTSLGYTRSDFNYRSYSSSGNIGYYTGVYCNDIDIDHVVSLKDAYDSGAHAWSTMEKEKFANDRENHVEACTGVNRSKSDSVPKDFLRRSRDGQGRDYNIKNWCPYVVKYHHIKNKYNLSTARNDKRLLLECGVSMEAAAAKQRVTSSATTNQTQDGDPMDWAKAKCELIGFGKDNPKHFNCIVNLMELK